MEEEKKKQSSRRRDPKTSSSSQHEKKKVLGMNSFQISDGSLPQGENKKRIKEQLNHCISRIMVKIPAQLQGMLRHEIEEAQVEIMEKLNPALLKLLKKRGEEKLKQKKVSAPNISANREPENVQNEDANDAKSSPFSESSTTRRVAKITSDDSHDGLDNRGTWNSKPANSSLWKAWSERVEAIRDIRFSLDGAITGSDLVQVSETGNITMRDFLRTEGDPGAAGYTIKEAVALTRSVIPGQRTLALQILLAVLDKALHNIQQGQVGCTARNVDNVYNSVDWEAVWAYALGPEPELVLSLRGLPLDLLH
nr:transcriptional elongation regulator MINIYO-like isoform X1 [Ziziphus jujuba var. spinosa]